MGRAQQLKTVLVKKEEVTKNINGMIGLEIHVYLITKEKLFCRCIASREKGLKPNIHICPICCGYPGAKPMLPNKSAVEKSILIGLMLGCSMNKQLVWQRKHYDWPDLPKGYQNTLSGRHAIPVGVHGRFFGIRISEMHLEEDPASWDPATGRVDYNRSGLPLVEIVTEPDFTTGEEVTAWLKKLLHHIAYLKGADTNAGMKVDVNVNIPKETERVEIKNISSLESIGKAIEYELERQMREGSERETRRFDDVKGKTMKMREKETGEDYRFLSDPDLQDLVLNEKMIVSLKEKLPEMPEVKLKKLVKQYGMNMQDAEVLARNIDLVEFFEKVAKKIDATFALPWITGELLRLLNAHSTTLDQVQIKSEHVVALLKLVQEGKVTPLKGKEILKQFYPRSFAPVAVEEKISDRSLLEKVARVVIAENTRATADVRAGEKKALDFLMGKIMEKTKKRADYKIARKVLEKVIQETS